MIRCCGSGLGAALGTGQTATRPPCGSRRPARVRARPPSLQSMPRRLTCPIDPLNAAGAYTASHPFAAGQRMQHEITFNLSKHSDLYHLQVCSCLGPQVRRPRPSLRRLSLLPLVSFPASEPQCRSSRQLHLVSAPGLSVRLHPALSGAHCWRSNSVAAAILAAGPIAGFLPFGHLLAASELGTTIQCSASGMVLNFMCNESYIARIRKIDRPRVITNEVLCHHTLICKSMQAKYRSPA